MPYFTDLHTYLHQSSLLIQAYPSTRITTKYSLPRKANSKSRPNPSKEQSPASAPLGETTSAAAQTQGQVKRDPSAILTLKTFHPESGICLKYRTDKAAEVGRLLAGLGRLAKGEIIEMPTAANGQTAIAAMDDADKMDVDSGNGAGVVVPKAGDNVVAAPPAASQPGGGGGGGKGKKKKGKK
jgi:hypothetical protein